MKELADTPRGGNARVVPHPQAAELASWLARAALPFCR